MKKIINILMVCALSLGSLMNPTPSKAEEKNPLNGSWQYLVRRKDNRGGIGTFGKPECPFYVGYFNLDFKKVKAERAKDAYTFTGDDASILPVTSNVAFHVSSNNIEKRGSYTPVEQPELCKMPNTALGGETAPITINSVSQDYSKIEWVTNFSDGEYKQPVFWKTKAEYIPSKDEIHGALKVYMCSKSSRQCSILNTTQFIAKRVKNIEEAAQKPLSATFPEFKLKPGELVSLVFDQVLASSDYFKFSSSDYVKPSIQAVFPAFAQHTGSGAIQRTNCAGGQCWCLNPSDPGSACVKCKWVNCPDKEGQPAPAGREELCNDKYTQGRCYDQAGPISCNKYGSC